MKWLNIFLLVLILLPSCIFSERSLSESEIEERELNNNSDLLAVRGDSVTINAVVGGYEIFYKVTKIENNSVNKTSAKQIDKVVLFNIQKTDTTSIAAYKTLEMADLVDIMAPKDLSDYVISDFYLKEVKSDSVVFFTKLCKFEENSCINVDLIIEESGAMIYRFDI